MKLLTPLIICLQALLPWEPQAQELTDLEAVTRTDSTLFFDYRLHRNPAYIYKYLQGMDSTKKLNQVHLYRGSVIYGGNSGDQKTHLTGRYKLDFQLAPYYTARFGDSGDPFRTQIGLGPLLQFNTRWGLFGVAQWLIPIQNDFKEVVGYGNRPGEVGVGFSRVLHKKSYFNAFAGTFSGRRYGLSGEFIQMNEQGTIYYGGGLYYSGAYIYRDNTFIREVMNYGSGYVFFAYRLIKSDITLRLTAERYLNNDHGVRFEALRQFGNTDIGFFGQKSQNGDNGGFILVVSLWPRKFYSNSFFQARLPNSFRIQYDFLNEPKIGTSVRNQTNFFFDILRFNPHFIDNQLGNQTKK